MKNQKNQPQVYGFMNIMAEFLAVMEASPIPVMAYSSINDSHMISPEAMEKLDAAFVKGMEDWMDAIADYRETICHSSDPSRFVYAFQLICWMDQHISYEETSRPASPDDLTGKDETQGVLSLKYLMPGEASEPIVTGALNDNYAETKIWINPKYEIAGGYFHTATGVRERPIPNRDAFRGMNAVLTNCCYTRWNERISYRNIILPYPGNSPIGKRVKDEEYFKVAFSPITSDDPLDLDYMDVNEKGLELHGIGLKGYKQEDVLNDRFRSSWMRACEEEVGIYFGPEMVGTPKLYEEEDGRLKVLADMSEEAKKAGLTPPCLTVMPGKWEAGESQALLADQNGYILGRVRRYVQFIDKADHMVEYMGPVTKREFCIIHLPGLYRIGVVICAEFLPQDGNDSVELLCREIGCNMLIVPSFSAGEHDYLNSIPAVRVFGTSVVWGNCCAAHHFAPRIIGGVTVAGTDYIGRLGSFCQCDHACRDQKGCVFILRFPLRTCMDKPDSTPMDEAVEHILFDM